MSTFYLSVNAVSRGKGQSAVASASYRSGESLYHELDMETKSYKKRSIKPDSFILAPDHAPEWVYNREKLWNEVEWIESNANSRLAREIRVALPIELNHEMQRELLESYVKDNFVDEGMVADVSIHRDTEHNPHAHILLTIRPFEKEGDWLQKKSKKEYLKDTEGNFIYNNMGNKKSRKIDLVGWDRKELVSIWRKNYAEIVNQYYKENEINEKVSHESYEKQGVEKTPKHRLSITEYEIEKKQMEKANKRGVEYKPRTYFASLNAEIINENKEIQLLNDKVVSLGRYRESVKDKIIDELSSLRYSFSLSDEDWKSLKIVAKRTNGFVDVDHTFDNIKRLDNWKMKLDKQRNEIKALGKLLLEVKSVYNDDPKAIIIYGFKPSTFIDSYKEKENILEKHVGDYKAKISAYNEMNEHSQRAYTIQKSFANEEFKYLYPAYANKLNDNDKSMKLKSYYIKKFKNDGVLKGEIPELENNCLVQNKSR